MKLNKNTTMQKNHSAQIGYITAKGFLLAAETGMQHIWRAGSSDDVTEELRKNRGVIIASAINLSLSAELSIKCLLLAHDLGIPKTHDLDKLYRGLPLDLKRQFSEEYGKNKGIANSVISIGLTKQIQQKAAGVGVVSGSFEKAIKRNRKTFSKHRVIYELDSRPDTVDFRFTELRIIAELLLAPCSQMFDKSRVTISKSNDVDLSKRTSDTKSRDGLTVAQLSIETANKLTDPARNFLDNHVNTSPNTQSKSEPIEIERIPAAVVGASLAIEMCFKSICLTLNVPYDDSSHGLIGGYANLPQNVQQKIKSYFDQKKKENGPGRSYALSWSHGKINNKKTDDFIKTKAHGMEIEDILKRTSNSFVDWRYCYENSSVNEQKDMEISLGAIVYLANAAIITAVDVINNTKKYS